MTYTEDILALQRLTILQALLADPQYSVNDRILLQVIGARGPGLFLDALRAELRWLADRGLVKLDDGTGGDVYVAELTKRGVDVAKGLVIVEGIARPEPAV